MKQYIRSTCSNRKSINKLLRCSCVICKSDVSVSNLDKHFKSNTCLSGGKASFIKKFPPGLTVCPFCSVKKLTHNSLCQHAVRCPKNPNRKISPRLFGGNKHKKPAWNKGLTKLTDSRVAARGRRLSESMKSGKIPKPPNLPKSEETLKKLSRLAKERKLGGVRPSRKILYSGVLLGSTYELVLAKSLDENKIKWCIPNRLLYVDMNGKTRSYQADFYLPEYNVYLDPKNDYLINNVNPRLGFKDSDKIKWVEEYNNVHIFVLNKNQLSWAKVLTLLDERNAP